MRLNGALTEWPPIAPWRIIVCLTESSYEQVFMFFLKLTGSLFEMPIQDKRHSFVVAIIQH